MFSIFINRNKTLICRLSTVLDIQSGNRCEDLIFTGIKESNSDNSEKRKMVISISVFIYYYVEWHFCICINIFSQLHTQTYAIVQRQVLSFHKVKPLPGGTMILMGTMVTITSSKFNHNYFEYCDKSGKYLANQLKQP